MKKNCFILIALITVKTAMAQTKPAAPAMPDINKLMKMTPDEIEAYKKQVINNTSAQIKQLADDNNSKIDEMTLPDFEVKQPVKNTKRLALLPVQPPTLIQLTDALKKSKQQLESVTPKTILDEVKGITAQQTPAEMQSSSIDAFYNDKPVQALLIAMQSVLTNPAEVIAWNNLSALYNLTGLQHKAIPILMHFLQKLPGNSLLLNNMGQAYLGLGDIQKAKTYLQQCLVQDPLHPEANRGMGLICLFEKKPAQSKQHFEKELEITQRASTVTLIEKQQFPINVFLIRKNKSKSLPSHNYFNDIQLGKFKMPEFPHNTDEKSVAAAKHGEFGASVANELVFWLNESLATPEQLAKEGKQYPGLYARQVERLLKDLHEAYKAYDLTLFNDIHVDKLQQMMDVYNERMQAVVCPEYPVNATAAIMMAYQKKCCDIKKPIIDEYVANYNSFVTMRVNAVSGLYKQYINDLINVVSLTPSTANRRYVSQVVYEYFVFLGTASQAGLFLDPPSECNTKLTTEQANEIIESSRKIKMDCPDNFQLNLNLKVVTIKADCSTYSLEGEYEAFSGAYTHSFKTGTSTLTAGAGISANFFKDFGNASLSQSVFVSWDNNNMFTDFGIKGSASIGLDPLGGVAADYSAAISSGWSSSVTPTGAIASFISMVDGM